MLNLSHVSASAGQSAGAKDDYIEREGKYEKDKAELVQCGHEHMPDFAQDNPRDFWRAADEHERKNARLCSEIRVALPKELNEAQQVDLVHTFIQERLNNQPCTWALHQGKGTNPHCHMIYSERTNEPDNQHEREVFFKRNGAKKNRALKEKDWLDMTRKEWSRLANEHLLQSGHDVQIDHRRLDVQCAEQIKATEMELQKDNPNRAIIRQHVHAAELLDRDPQEKKRWLHENGEARLVAYEPSKFKPERLQVGMIEELKGAIMAWMVSTGEIVLQKVQSVQEEALEALVSAARSVAIDKAKQREASQAQRLKQREDRGMELD